MVVGRERPFEGCSRECIKGRCVGPLSAWRGHCSSTWMRWGSRLTCASPPQVELLFAPKPVSDSGVEVGRLGGPQNSGSVRGGDTEWVLAVVGHGALCSQLWSLRTQVGRGRLWDLSPLGLASGGGTESKDPGRGRWSCPFTVLLDFGSGSSLGSPDPAVPCLLQIVR